MTDSFTLSPIDVVVFALFVASVVSLGIFMSRSEGGSESYFLAGRGLRWWLIGFSLIAANISTEQFVGMSGQAADYIGLAIASYEWMAAITLVVVAFGFLPTFLRTGIYTIPEFLSYRYNETSRSIMAFFTMMIYVGVTIAAVIYSGALTINTLFPSLGVTASSWIIGVIAAVYVAAGGLKACAWADLIQGSALILAGALITWFALAALGAAPLSELASTVGATPGLTDGSSGVEKFFALNENKLRMILPAGDTILPWTALVVGLWIPNFYYWGLNQYVTQRTLGARSLAEGQKGIVFAAALKLVIPFVIVFPGIAAFNLFSGEMAELAKADPQIQANWQRFEAALDGAPSEAPPTRFELDPATAAQDAELAAQVAAVNERAVAQAQQVGAPVETLKLQSFKYDSAFGLLIRRLIPSGVGMQGFVIAAILGAVVSSLAAMLNAASTIFTMDLYRKYLHRAATEATLVRIGRVCVGVFVAIGCVIAPLLGHPRFGGIFTYIQEFQGFISPGILAVFVFGFLVRRAPPVCGVVGLLINPAVYAALKLLLPSLAFLDRMAVSFACVLAVMYAIARLKPLRDPVVLPRNSAIELDGSAVAKLGGFAVVAVAVALYVVFW